MDVKAGHYDRRVTLKDVARAVGGAPSTVSNAYNRPDQLSEAQRAPVDGFVLRAFADDDPLFTAALAPGPARPPAATAECAPGARAGACRARRRHAKLAFGFAHCRPRSNPASLRRT